MAGSLAKLVGRAPDYGELSGMLAQAGRNVELAVALLSQLMRSWPDGREKRVDLVDLEHENDAVTHDVTTTCTRARRSRSSAATCWRWPRGWTT